MPAVFRTTSTIRVAVYLAFRGTIMPLTAEAAKVAQLSAMDLYKSIHGSKGFHKVVVHQIGGSRLDFYAGLGDDLATEKIGGVRLAVHKVTNAGMVMPAVISIYTSPSPSFVNVAFQRAIGGAQEASIGLGGKLATPAMLPNGMATIHGKGSTVDFVAAVCVHEIGHILHESFDPEFFWSAAANATTPPSLGGKVSMYAAANIKEFVAEVFTGMIYGQRFDKELMEEYEKYHGPSSVTFPG